MPPHRRRFAVRSADLGHRLDTFLVVAIASVLGNRLFLVITGYPQLGNGTLHISHAIWGALMMAMSIIAALSFLAPSTRGVVAVLGGAGFGWFIDELGKFITRDVNYFFEPTFALIYITFVVMYLVFRSLERRNFQPEEGIVNALDALQSAAIGQLDEPSRRQALALLASTGATGPVADQVRVMLEQAATTAQAQPSRLARTAAHLRRRYLEVTSHPRFPTVVDVIFLVLAISEVIGTIAFALDGPGIVTFAERVTVVASIVSNVLVIVGAVWLPFSRDRAYRWFERGLLFDIFVTQVFVFAEEQLAGTIGLAFTMVFWALLRSAMHAEREQAAMGGDW